MYTYKTYIPNDCYWLVNVVSFKRWATLNTENSILPLINLNSEIRDYCRLLSLFLTTLLTGK